MVQSDSNSILTAEIARGSRDRDGGRSELTIQEILDIQKQVDKALDKYLFSAEWIEEEVEVPETNIDPVTKKETTTTRKMKIHRYKPVPTEEKIIGCRMLNIDCNEQVFMPDENAAYAVNSDVFDGYCVIYPDNYANNKNKETAVEKLRVHLETVHKKKWDKEFLKYNARWLTWNPMFNRKGFDKVKSYIMLRVSSVFSTSIVSEVKGKIGGMSTSQQILNDAVDAAQINLQDIVYHAREYGFKLSLTQAAELFNFEADLFNMALSRNLNGITLRGLLSAQSESNVTYTQKTENNQDASSIFKLGK